MKVDLKVGKFVYKLVRQFCSVLGCGISRVTVLSIRKVLSNEELFLINRVFSIRDEFLPYGKTQHPVRDISLENYSIHV